MVIPPTVGPIGLTFSLLSVPPAAIWLVLASRRLFKLGSIE